ncbi:MAG: hypothetical protein ABIC40_06515 [bacterium]
MSRYITLILSFSVFLTSFGCAGIARWDFEKYPTYPYDSHDKYDGTCDGGKDFSPIWAQSATGQWQGFLWEDYRTDYIPYAKRLVAMRCVFSKTTFDYSGRHEWIKCDVLIDGHPTASKIAEISPYGDVWFDSYQNNIDFEFDGLFRNNYADGRMSVDWDEKVYLPGTSKTEMHHVYLEGDFELGRVKGSQWESAWELFDNYGENAWTLPDEIWREATKNGLEALSNQAVVIETGVRTK